MGRLKCWGLGRGDESAKGVSLLLFRPFAFPSRAVLLLLLWGCESGVGNAHRYVLLIFQRATPLSLRTAAEGKAESIIVRLSRTRYVTVT